MGRVDVAAGKLVLQGAEDRDALRELLNLGRSRFGYDIDLSSLADAEPAVTRRRYFAAPSRRVANAATSPAR